MDRDLRRQDWIIHSALFGIRPEAGWPHPSDVTHILERRHSRYHLPEEICRNCVVKRLLSCVLVFGLVLLAPSPGSLCALLSSVPGECATPETQSQCENMDMGIPPVQSITTQTASCCTVSQAPLPESKSELAKSSAQVPAENLLSRTAEIIERDDTHTTPDLQDTSPPPLQSLLCTFLI